MNFYVIPEMKPFGPISADTLRYALAIKHCLLARMCIKSTIEDADGIIVSEKEQSEHIYHLLG